MLSNTQYFRGVDTAYTNQCVGGFGVVLAPDGAKELNLYPTLSTSRWRGLCSTFTFVRRRDSMCLAWSRHDRAKGDIGAASFAIDELIVVKNHLKKMRLYEDCVFCGCSRTMDITLMYTSPHRASPVYTMLLTRDCLGKSIESLRFE